MLQLDVRLVHQEASFKDMVALKEALNYFRLEKIEMRIQKLLLVEGDFSALDAPPVTSGSRQHRPQSVTL
jgi:hypothetical protein